MYNVFTFSVKEAKAYLMKFNSWSGCLVSDSDVFMTYPEVPAWPLFFFFSVSISRGFVSARSMADLLNRKVEL